MPSRADAVAAATAVGRAAGFASTAPTRFPDTSNVVVRLDPHPVVAKVGVWGHSHEHLGREVEVCAPLYATGAPVAPPIGPLRVDDATGLPVSLWAYLPTGPGPADAAAIAHMLRRVHAGLQQLDVALPSYLSGIDHARATLGDDGQMAALPSADRATLRSAYDRWAADLRARETRDQPIHGEPHPGNLILTADGPVLIDFETASRGPIEWDLASQPAEVAAQFDVDVDLLLLARRLNSARVATWCWAAFDSPGMRAHGEHHLQVVRDALAAGA